MSYTDNVKGVSQTADEQGIKYGPYKDMPPYSFDMVRMLFKYKDPLLILTQATKSVHVSHWGNILVDEAFELQNIGATLKGEFSRLDYQMNHYGENCLKEISAKYPWYI